MSPRFGFLSCFLLLAGVSFSVVFGTSHLRCEDLPVEDCAFAVSSSGNRCVLEKFTSTSGEPVFECQTSDITAAKPEEWIESDECIRECGLEKMWVGFSSDGLAQRAFVSKLCSPICQNNCANIVDLFTSLAESEGVSLAKVCNFVRPSSHRILADSLNFKNTEFVLQSLASSSAPAPESSLAESLTLAPAPAPFN